MTSVIGGTQGYVPPTPNASPSGGAITQQVPTAATPKGTSYNLLNQGTMDPITMPNDLTNQQSVQTYNTATTQATTLDQLGQLIDNAAAFQENLLNSYYNPTYHFKFYITTEDELIDVGAAASGNSANSGTIASVYAALDKLPKIIIAESGVTAGFNIKDVEFDQTITPGFKSHNTILQSIKMTIVEPLGASLIECMLSAASALDVQNFSKMWYFLELSFLGYDEHGAIPAAPTPIGSNLPNGGRWIYKVSITDMDIHMDEGGATYSINMISWPQTAYNDDECGRVPDNIKVSGNTIKEFLNNLGNSLNDIWKARYVGEIYKFNFKIDPVDGTNLDPNNFSLKQTDIDPIHTEGLEVTAIGNGMIAQIDKGTTIADLILYLYAHCEEAQNMMLDVNAQHQLEDSDSAKPPLVPGGEATATYNKKPYRVPIVPLVETDIVVTGYDDITGKYIKNITYTIHSYRNYSTNISPKQEVNVRNDPQLGAKIGKELSDRGYLQKRYEHRFTGENTEVIRFDLDFNFQYSAVLPKQMGWRADSRSVAVHAKQNPQLADNDMSFQNELNELEADPGKLTILQLSDLTTKLATAYDNANAIVNAPASDTSVTDQDRKDAAQTVAKVTQQRTLLASQVAIARNNSLTLHQQTRDQIKKNSQQNVYAESLVKNSNPFKISYSQQNNESEQSTGTGFNGPWHRGSSLVGALFNQLHAPVSQALINISLDIRGDPYWLGYSNVERSAILAGMAPKAKSTDPIPDIYSGDSAIALIFRFPSKIDDQTGVPVIRRDDFFSGLYRVTEVKHSFSEGQFKQTLSANKLELVQLPMTQQTNDNTSGDQAAASTQTTPYFKNSTPPSS